MLSGEAPRFYKGEGIDLGEGGELPAGTQTAWGSGLGGLKLAAIGPLQVSGT